MGPGPYKIDGMVWSSNQRGIGFLAEHAQGTAKGHNDLCFGDWACKVTETCEPRIWKQFGGNTNDDDPSPKRGNIGWGIFVAYSKPDSQHARMDCKAWLVLVRNRKPQRVGHEHRKGVHPSWYHERSGIG